MQLGEVAIERTQVAALDRDLAGVRAKDDGAKAVPLGLEQIVAFGGSASTALASIGSIGATARPPRRPPSRPMPLPPLSHRRSAVARFVAMVRRDSSDCRAAATTGNGHAIIARAMAPIAIDPSARRSATTWVGRGLLFVAIVFLLEHARPLLLPVTIAIVFTFVLAAPVRALQRAGIHEYIGAALVIGAVLGVAVVLLMLVAAPAAAWWARAPLIVHELVEALQGWRDALFPYAPPAPLVRAPAARRGRPARRAARERRLDLHPPGVGETISFALSASATVILLYFMLASERWLVARTVAVVRRPRRAR